MFFNGTRRTDTSCGLSVSRIARSLSISGNFDFGAAMISRLADLSGQIRTCAPAADAAPPAEGEESPPGDSGPGEGMGAPGGEGPPEGERPPDGEGPVDGL